MNEQRSGLMGSFLPSQKRFRRVAGELFELPDEVRMISIIQAKCYVLYLLKCRASQLAHGFFEATDSLICFGRNTNKRFEFSL